MPDRVVNVIHPAPVTRLGPRTREPRLHWVRMSTPVRLREVGRTEIGEPMRARGRWGDADLHAMDGALWSVPRLRHGHVGEYGSPHHAEPYAGPGHVVAFLENRLHHFQRESDVVQAFSGTPVSAELVGRPGDGPDHSRGDLDAPLDRLVDDGREAASRRVSEWFGRSVASCGDRVLVRTHGLLLRRTRHVNHWGGPEHWSIGLGGNGGCQCGRVYPLADIAAAHAFEEDLTGAEVDRCGLTDDPSPDPGLTDPYGDVVATANRIVGEVVRVADTRILAGWTVQRREAILDMDGLDLRAGMAALRAWVVAGATGGIDVEEAADAVDACRRVLAGLGGVEGRRVEVVLAPHLANVRHFDERMAPRLRAMGHGLAEGDVDALAGLSVP